MGSILLWLPASYQPKALIGFRLPGFGIVIALVVLLTTGLIVSNLIGKRLVQYWDGVIRRIPLVRSIHGGVKSFAEFRGERVLAEQLVPQGRDDPVPARRGVEHWLHHLGGRGRAARQDGRGAFLRLHSDDAESHVRLHRHGAGDRSGRASDDRRLRHEDDHYLRCRHAGGGIGYGLPAKDSARRLNK
jgi:hypothetical protein